MEKKDKKKRSEKCGDGKGRERRVFMDGPSLLFKSRPTTDHIIHSVTERKKGKEYL